MENKIKIVLISDYVNVFNLSFCLELYKNEKVDFKFYVSQRFDLERAKNGLQDLNHKYSFVYRVYDEDFDYKLYLNDINQCDLLIVGAVSNYKKLIKERMKSNKFTLVFSERLFKQKLSPMVAFRNVFRFFRHFNIYFNKNLFLLSVGYFSSRDYEKILSFKNKSFKWMYFPETNELNINKILEDKKKKDVIDILWVGRMLDWKHPMYVAILTNELIKQKYKIRTTFIGHGPELDNIKEYVHANNIDKYVFFKDGLPNNEVREYMVKSDIYLFTSDRGEGWGAVLNEAMSSGLAIVASSEAGSSQYLLKDGENGFLYYNNDINELIYKTKVLLDSVSLRDKFSLNAYNTIINEWNAKIATTRLLKFYEAIKNGNDKVFEDGLLSKV